MIIIIIMIIIIMMMMMMMIITIIMISDKSLIVLSIPSGSCHQMLFRIYPKEYLLH